MSIDNKIKEAYSTLNPLLDDSLNFWHKNHKFLEKKYDQQYILITYGQFIAANSCLDVLQEILERGGFEADLITHTGVPEEQPKEDFDLRFLIDGFFEDYRGEIWEKIGKIKEDPDTLISSRD